MFSLLVFLAAGQYGLVLRRKRMNRFEFEYFKGSYLDFTKRLNGSQVKNAIGVISFSGNTIV